jgi:hypothetical protein
MGIETTEYRCEGLTLSVYDSNGEKSSIDSKCVYGCYDSQRCRTQQEAEEVEEIEDVEVAPIADEYVNSKV